MSSMDTDPYSSSAVKADPPAQPDPPVQFAARTDGLGEPAVPEAHDLSVPRPVEPSTTEAEDRSQGTWLSVGAPYSDLHMPDDDVHLTRQPSQVPDDKVDAVRNQAAQLGIPLVEAGNEEE
jgi:hypothetical protein